MEHELTFRQRVLAILVRLSGLAYKQIAGRIGWTPTAVSDLLTRFRRSEIQDDDYEAVLAGVTRKRAEAPIVEGLVESLDALRRENGLSEEAQTWAEERIRDGARLLRTCVMAMLLRLQSAPTEEDYPYVFEVPAARQRAEKQFAELKRLPPPSRLAVVRYNEDYQNWALLERCCEASVEEVSRNLWCAASWARLALAIAKLVRGPEPWRNRNRGYAFAHWANILKVRGELNAADSFLERGKRLWEAGADPTGVFDPGRLLDIEGSLRRDQRRFDEALFAFDSARAVSRFPERALMMKGTTYDVMGDYERALATYLEAEPLVVRRGDQRLLYMVRFNIAASLTCLDRYPRAAELLHQVRELISERGDEIEKCRVMWLEGRILAGLGRVTKALQLLAEARRRFVSEKMFYDVALALLEEAVLLLGQNRTSEVKALALKLTEVFESKGVHREAMAALQLFQEAAEKETASADLARRILRFMLQARHNKDLSFES